MRLSLLGNVALLQLTNILRDVKQDAEQGRIYLPAEDFAKAGYTVAELQGGVRNEGFARLMQMEIARAETYYDQAKKLTEYLDPAGQKICGAMVGTYHGLLEKMKHAESRVFDERVRLGKVRKLRIALQWLLSRPQPTLVESSSKRSSGAHS